MKLWHDDVRPAPKGWVWARRNEEAMFHLLNSNVEQISMDHDLGFHDVDLPDDPDEAMEVLVLRGSSPETGYELVNWMIEHDRVPPVIRIHSWNPDGAKAMAARLNQYGHNCEIRPFNPKELAA